MRGSGDPRRSGARRTLKRFLAVQDFVETNGHFFTRPAMTAVPPKFLAPGNDRRP